MNLIASVTIASQTLSVRHDAMIGDDDIATNLRRRVSSRQALSPNHVSKPKRAAIQCYFYPYLVMSDCCIKRQKKLLASWPSRDLK